MNVLYTRVSTIDQKTDRQRVIVKDYALIVEDKISGSVPFFERPGGIKIKKLTEKGLITKLNVWTIDRLGRNLLDVLSTIEYFTKKKISICFVSQSLCTLDAEGKEIPTTTLMIQLLSAVAQMERSQIRERQYEGIQLAKAQGLYTGRKKGSKESVLDFLQKPQNQKALTYFKQGMSRAEVIKLTSLNKNTLTKIKKLGLPVTK